MDIWSELGIEPTDDRSTIRRAYARRLKLNRPDQDPAGFERLRYAYEIALSDAEASYAEAQEPPPVPSPAPAPASPPPSPPESTFRERRIDPSPESVEESEPSSIPERDRQPEHVWRNVPEAEPEREPDANEPSPEPALDPAQVWADDQSAALWEAIQQRNGKHAIALFDKLISHESMSGFEARWQLEHWLLATLNDAPVPPPAFIRVLASEFRWREDATRLPGHLHDLVDSLFAELELDELLQQYRDDAPEFKLRFLSDGQALARWLLGRDHRPVLCDYATLNPTTFQALKGQWQELEVFGPDALSRHFPAEQFTWWNENVENGPRWFLRVAQFFQKTIFIPVAGAAILCVAGLPSVLMERVTGSSLFLSFFVPYVGISLGVVLSLIAAWTSLSLFTLRAGRRFGRWAEAPLAAIERRLSAIRAATVDRYLGWHRTLSPTGRRVVDLFVLVILACLFWIGFVALLWVDNS